MRSLFLLLAAALLSSALAACAPMGVSTMGSTNVVNGAPGTPGDLATGGQGDQFHNDRD